MTGKQLRKTIAYLTLTFLFISNTAPALSTPDLGGIGHGWPQVASGGSRESADAESLTRAFRGALHSKGEGITALAPLVESKLTALDGASDDEFGTAVAISGDTAIVGSPDDDVITDERGSAYIFVRTPGGWVQQQKLTASDGREGDNFGIRVGISGDTVIVGAWRADAPAEFQGAAYIFVRSGTSWTEQAKLTALDGAAGDLFGSDVAISGDTVIIGAPTDDVASADQGSAYIFVRSGSTWTGQAKITALDGAESDLFGDAVAISGNTVIIGAIFDDVAGENQGSAYIYVRSGTTWSGQEKLTALDGAAFDTFGRDVDISLDTVIIGADGDDVASDGQGSAYVFTRSGNVWTGQAKLTTLDGQASDAFGYRVAVDGDKAVISSISDDAWGVTRGSVYLFTRSGTQWTEYTELTASDGRGGFFSYALDISADAVIVGAGKDDVGENLDQGSAYVFRRSSFSTPYDFDGDGKSDIGIYRPGPFGQWWINRSSNGSTLAMQFGNEFDRIIPGDFTGDGRSDIAVWKPSNGTWYVVRSSDFTFYGFPFGVSTDVPVPADYDNDAKTDAAVFRPSNSTWYVRRSTDGQATIQTFGANGDVPVPADYDGDGRADVAIFRPSNGQWWINRSTAGVIAITFGNSSDKPVQGDYTGDGKADVAFFRPSTAEWFVLRSENFSYYSVLFGSAGDIPAPGDYDGDGRIDTTVFRPSNVTWYSNRSTAGTLIQQFGQTGDRPIANAFVP